MQPVKNIVLAQHDPASAQVLATMLDRHFTSVRLVCSLDELERAIPHYRADVAVVDLEMVPLDAVGRLAQEFPVRIICTHRIPDEQMWTAALEAGAIDCCPNDDVRGIVSAVDVTRAQAA